MTFASCITTGYCLTIPNTSICHFLSSDLFTTHSPRQKQVWIPLAYHHSLVLRNCNRTTYRPRWSTLNILPEEGSLWPIEQTPLKSCPYEAPDFVIGLTRYILFLSVLWTSCSRTWTLSSGVEAFTPRRDTSILIRHSLLRVVPITSPIKAHPHLYMLPTYTSYPLNWFLSNCLSTYSNLLH